MIIRICSVCGMGLGVKEGLDGIGHGLCIHCEAFEQARNDAEDISDICIYCPPITVTGLMWSAYRWRATANVLKQLGWTFPNGTFIGDER